MVAMARDAVFHHLPKAPILPSNGHFWGAIPAKIATFFWQNHKRLINQSLYFRKFANSFRRINHCFHTESTFWAICKGDYTTLRNRNFTRFWVGSTLDLTPLFFCPPSETGGDMDGP